MSSEGPFTFQFGDGRKRRLARPMELVAMSNTEDITLMYMMCVEQKAVMPSTVDQLERLMSGTSIDFSNPELLRVMLVDYPTIFNFNKVTVIHLHGDKFTSTDRILLEDIHGWRTNLDRMRDYMYMAYTVAYTLEYIPKREVPSFIFSQVCGDTCHRENWRQYFAYYCACFDTRKEPESETQIMDVRTFSSLEQLQFPKLKKYRLLQAVVETYIEKALKKYGRVMLGVPGKDYSVMRPRERTESLTSGCKTVRLSSAIRPEFFKFCEGIAGLQPPWNSAKKTWQKHYTFAVSVIWHEIGGDKTRDILIVEYAQRGD